MFHSGDVIDQYRLSTVLGSGSYGVVFKAENTVSKQACALKIIPLCGHAGTRELRALRQYHNIEHPNLLKIHHSGIAGDYLYYTMDLADGKLADQKLLPDQLRSVAVKLADALALLHEHGLIHRDIKPDNLFYLNGEPVIGDIGLVTADCGASLTGTPGFLPPAVRKSGKALSELSDLYALAKSLYCLLSGNPPEDYPRYTGPVDPDSAILLQAVLAVCDDTGEITSAAGFCDFLHTKKIRKKKHYLPWIAACLSGVLLLVAAIYFSFRLFHPQSRGEQMFSAVLKADRFTSAEQAAIDRQEKIYEELKAEAEKQADNKYPRHPGKMTSFNAVFRRHQFYEEKLAELIREKDAEDPAFHCFYVLYNEAEQASFVLYKLKEHPEYAEALEDSFRQWQEKYAEYSKQRNALLKQKSGSFFQKIKTSGI